MRLERFDATCRTKPAYLISDGRDLSKFSPRNLMFANAVCSFVLMHACASSSADEYWRNADHNSVNTVVFFLNLIGVDCDSARAYSPQGQPVTNNLYQLIELASQFGVSLQAKRLNVEQLKNVQLPFIVLLEADSQNGNEFCVVLGHNSNGSLTIFYGGSATIGVIDWETFLRRWDGIAATTRSHHGFQPVVLVVGMLGGVILSLVLSRIK